MIEEIRGYEFICRPFDVSFPIRSMIVTIYAKSRKEAELIKLNYDYKFFEQDMFVTVNELPLQGYKQVIEPVQS